MDSSILSGAFENSSKKRKGISDCQFSQFISNYTCWMTTKNKNDTKCSEKSENSIMLSNNNIELVDLDKDSKLGGIEEVNDRSFGTGENVILVDNTESSGILKYFSYSYWKQGKTGCMFLDDFIIGRKLGSGAFSVVKEAVYKGDGVSYAIKICPKSKLSTSDKVCLKEEIEILQSLNHPHIIRLYAIYSEPSHLYLVTELVEGGELLSRLLSKKTYSENETKEFCLIFFDVINYMHSKMVAHRDLKLENLLLINKNTNVKIKIIDFNMAKRVTSSNCLKTRCGSLSYVAPEVLRGEPYGTQVDMWSVGVIIHTLLVGYLPFVDKDEKKLYRKIRLGKFQFHGKVWSKISNAAKNIVFRLFITNPSQRLNAKEALKHTWFRIPDQLSLKKQKELHHLQKLKQFRSTNFNASRTIRKRYNVSTTSL